MTDDLRTEMILDERSRRIHLPVPHPLDPRRYPSPGRARKSQRLHQPRGHSRVPHNRLHRLPPAIKIPLHENHLGIRIQLQQLPREHGRPRCVGDAHEASCCLLEQLQKHRLIVSIFEYASPQLHVGCVWLRRVSLNTRIP